MNLKFSQISQLAQYSNDKIVDLIKTKIAESENAAVALVFDDKLVLLDENTENFYAVDYKIDGKKIELKNWEKINIIPDNQTKLEELAESYFDPTENKEIKVKEFVEAFKLKYSDEPVRKMINSTLTEKKRLVESNPKIKSLNKLREIRSEFVEDISEIIEDQKIKALNSNLSSPTQGFISKIDFKSPVSVYLMEQETDRVINISEKKMTKTKKKNIKNKVSNLWTSESFKKDFLELLSELNESENSVEVINRFVENHKEILILSESELEDLILKTTMIVGKAKLSEKMVDLFKEYYNLSETKNLRENYLKDVSIIEEENKDDLEAEEVADSDEKEKDEPETTIDEDSINRIIKVMNKIKEKLDDKSLEKKYIESFIKSLEDAKIGSIKEGKLKEILDFLSSVYDKANKSKSESEEK